MRVTTSVIKHFEEDQKRHGTKVALQNILWQVAGGLFADIGVKKIQTTYHKRAKGAY